MSSRTRTLGLSFGIVTLVAAAVACNGVLGITVAKVDPTLSEDANAPVTPAQDASDGAVNPNSCEAYCALLDKSCTGDNGEYTTVETCNEICKGFEPGRPGELTNDSLACRISQAHQAGSEPTLYCQAAGPLGTGSCAPDPCASFCALTFNVCNPSEVSPMPFKDDADCRAACATWPYIMAGDAGADKAGDIKFAATNTLNCRIYHLESAYEPGNSNARKVHCPHLANESSTCH